MVGFKERGRYKGVSLHEDIVQEIKNHVIKDIKYRSMADFVRESVRFKMDVDTGKIQPIIQPIQKLNQICCCPGCKSKKDCLNYDNGICNFKKIMLIKN